MPPKTDKCRACGRAVVWAQVALSGKSMPLDAECEPRPLPKMVLYNWSSGGARVVSGEDLDSGAVARWLRAAKVTVHRNHLNDQGCPINRARRQRGREAVTA